MDKQRRVSHLRTLQAVLAQVSEPERSEHAGRALEFFVREHPEEAARVDLGDYVERLARLHFGEKWGQPELAFSHWHVPQLEDFSPLWIRQAIVTRMQGLAGRREALFLVTGLRDAICPAGRYWTARRAAEYQRVRGWIDELVCAWASRGSRLRVVVI